MPTAPDWTPTLLTDAPRLDAAGAVHLWLMALDEPVRPHDELVALLDVAERQRAARFHFEVDRRRFEAAHGLLRLVLGHYAGAPPSQLRFESGHAGKPALAAAAAGVDFNLSHSGGHALLGVTRGAAIGVDIELIRSVPEFESIAAGTFAAEEVRELMAQPDALRVDAFFSGWTRKEAYIKALGGGLSIPLAGFEVSLAPREPALIRSISGSRAAAGAWTLWAGRPLTGTWAAAAVAANPVRLSNMSLR